jgi:hypothetical protein
MNYNRFLHGIKKYDAHRIKYDDKFTRTIAIPKTYKNLDGLKNRNTLKMNQIMDIDSFMDFKKRRLFNDFIDFRNKFKNSK